VKHVRAVVGYDLFHLMMDFKNGATPQIYSSEVLPQTGFSNICLRRDVIESGFSFAEMVFSENPCEELKSAGVAVEKHKWLQLHKKQQLPRPIAIIYIVFDQVRMLFRKVITHPRLQQTLDQFEAFYHSERVQALPTQISQTTLLFVQRGLATLRKLQPLLMRIGYQMQVWFRECLVKLQYRMVMLQGKRKSAAAKDPLQKQVYVPHLTSYDRGPETTSHSKSPEKPRFLLR
jgi:hypothetical protein